MPTAIDSGATAFHRSTQQAGNDALAGLIAAANAALDSDRDTAKACLDQAAALLQGRYVRARSKADGSAPPRGGLAPWQARQVCAYIDAHLSGRIRALDLAKVAQLSTSHFTRAFRETFGETPIGYVARQRMRYAQELMLSSRDCLSQIALACGHCDQSHFTRVFRRSVGMSPRAWRRQFATAPSDL